MELSNDTQIEGTEPCSISASGSRRKNTLWITPWEIEPGSTAQYVPVMPRIEFLVASWGELTQR